MMVLRLLMVVSFVLSVSLIAVGATTIAERIVSPTLLKPDLFAGTITLLAGVIVTSIYEGLQARVAQQTLRADTNE